MNRHLLYAVGAAVFVVVIFGGIAILVSGDQDPLTQSIHHNPSAKVIVQEKAAITQWWAENMNDPSVEIVSEVSRDTFNGIHGKPITQVVAKVRGKNGLGWGLREYCFYFEDGRLIQTVDVPGVGKLRHDLDKDIQSKSRKEAAERQAKYEHEQQKLRIEAEERQRKAAIESEERQKREKIESDERQEKARIESQERQEKARLERQQLEMKRAKQEEEEKEQKEVARQRQLRQTQLQLGNYETDREKLAQDIQALEKVAKASALPPAMRQKLYAMRKQLMDLDAKIEDLRNMIKKLGG